MALKAVAAPLGSPVGGTGTTDTIPRWTGASTLGDSGLIDNGTSIYTSTRRVGVDTSTTLANVKLQVGSAASLANYQGAPLGVVLPAGSGSWFELAENSASGTSFRISKDSSTGVVFNTNGKTIGFTAAGYTTAISSSQVVLTTSGNVGIGTASPTSFGGYTSLTVYNATNGGLIECTNGTRTVRIQAQGGGPALVGTTTGYDFAIMSNAIARITIVGSGVTEGNVGIGTASPASRLDVAGTITCDDAGTGLKLPATPGNTDPNTLDCYVDGGTASSGGATFTATLKGSVSDPTTPVTVTGQYVLVGKQLTLTIVFTGVTTTGASGIAYVTTDLAAALRPKQRSVGSVAFDNFTIPSTGGTFSDLRTDGSIYIGCGVNNAGSDYVTHNAGASRAVRITATYIIP